MELPEGLEIPDEIKNLSHEDAICALALIHNLAGKAMKSKDLASFSMDMAVKCRNVFTDVTCSMLYHFAMHSFMDHVSEEREKSKKTFGSVYIIEYQGGRIKIGKSINPKNRIKSLATMSAIKPVREWISYPSLRFSEVEISLHKKFSQQRQQGEFFDVEFEEAVSTAEAMFAGDIECESH